MGYYLPGFNRYVVADKTVDECRSLCCENPWCTSFDYAEQGDGKTHGPKTCWLSSAGEGVNGGGGLTWDPANNYHYYEVIKRGSRFMTLAQKKGRAPKIRAKIGFERLICSKPCNKKLLLELSRQETPNSVRVKSVSRKSRDLDALSFGGNIEVLETFSPCTNGARSVLDQRGHPSHALDTGYAAIAAIIPFHRHRCLSFS